MRTACALPTQAGTLVHALFERETPLLRACFALFGPDASGALSRPRLVRTGRLLQPVLPSGWARRLDTIATGKYSLVGFNEFASLLRSVDLHGSVSGGGGGGGGGGGERRRRSSGSNLLDHTRAQMAAAATLQELMEQVPPRLRRRCRTMRAAMADGGYPAREVIAVLRAMFAPPAETVAFDQALRDAYHGDTTMAIPSMAMPTTAIPTMAMPTTAPSSRRGPP